MISLKTYLEEVTENANLISGIRYIEVIISSLYTLSKFIKQDNQEEQISIKRKVEGITANLLKAAGLFGLQEYKGQAVQGTIIDNIELIIASLSKILTEYNDGLDDPLGWGKICMDAEATLLDSK